MKINQKFNPSNIKEIDTHKNNFFAEVSVEELPFEEQKENFNNEGNLAKKRADQEFRHKESDMAMKQAWSKLLRTYLTIFTIAMFITLWGNESTFYSFCYSSHCVNLGKFDLGETTLNFLITVGFAKVVGVVWLIVSHLFPKKNPKKNKLGNNHN